MWLETQYSSIHRPRGFGGGLTQYRHVADTFFFHRAQLTSHELETPTSHGIWPYGRFKDDS